MTDAQAGEPANRRALYLAATRERFNRLLASSPDSQRAAEVMTAQYLIDFRRLFHAFAVCPHVQCMADLLNVDAELVTARMLHLEPHERMILEVCNRRCVAKELAKPPPPGKRRPHAKRAGHGCA